jgi:ATP-dependent RNA helicase DeaD
MSTFRDLGLLESLLDSVEAMGFEKPTPIQEKAIPVFLARQNDLIALAQTGTGKTAAFGLPILHQLDVKSKHTQALVVAPTRELCMQITNDLKNFSRKADGMRIVAVYGGSSISTQIRELRQGAHIIVATPGRLMDLIDRGAAKLNQVSTVVLDEADEMLNMGFQEDIESILSNTPDTKYTGLFSATMPKEIRSIANKYLKDPIEVSAGKKNAASQDITHQYAVVHAKDKLPALKRIIDFNDDFFGIIFCTTKIETQDISDALVKAGYNADCLHGDLSQQQRDKVMGKFRKRVIRILCATDVAARGIDVNDITHVIHYHLPDDIENYTHRSGRTARAGKKGISVALLHIKEAYKLHQIEKMANLKFEKFLIPKREDLLAQRIKSFTANMLALEPDFAEPLKDEWLEPFMELSKEELIQKLFAREFSKLQMKEQEPDDLNVDETQRSGRGSSSSSSSSRSSHDDKDSVRLFVNLGKKDGIRYDDMRDLIFQSTKVSGRQIRDIDMQGVYSFFNTDEAVADQLVNGMNGCEYRGREVRIERADQQKSFGGGSRPSYPRRTAKTSSSPFVKSSGDRSFSKSKKPGAGKKRSW